MTDAWEKLWGSQKSAKPTKRLIDKPHKILTYWPGLRKATTSILIQLRTGKIGLRHYLSQIKVRDSARCECNLGSQTPRHVVLIYPLLQGTRKEMWHTLQEVPGLRLGTLDNLLTERKAAGALTNFMVESGLLGQFREVDQSALGTTRVVDEAETEAH